MSDKNLDSAAREYSQYQLSNANELFQTACAIDFKAGALWQKNQHDEFCEQAQEKTDKDFAALLREIEYQKEVMMSLSEVTNAEIKSLREKLGVAVDALSFYMDEGNWFLSHEHVEKHYLEISDDDSRRMTDFYIGGKIARKALDKINNWDKTKESGQNETT